MISKSYKCCKIIKIFINLFFSRKISIGTVLDIVSGQLYSNQFNCKKIHFIEKHIQGKSKHFVISAVDENTVKSVI